MNEAVGRAQWSFFGVVVSAGLLLASCSGDPELGEPPDGEQERAFADGKADDFLGDCEREHLLLFANDPGRDSDALVEAGLHRRAANNIVDFRAGEDGELGTEDDAYFGSAEEIDDVYFVGPVAMQQLTGAVVDYCQDQPRRTAETIFSPQPYYDSHLTRAIEVIEGAQHSIDMAMYSLSDNQVFDALGDAVERGVRVRLLFDSANGDHLDIPGSRSARLEDLGVDVRYINRIMHHKFAIIDGPQSDLLQASQARFFSGSANLSYGAATRYDENVTFHKNDPLLVLKIQREFNHLWGNSRDLLWNEDLVFEETMPIAQGMIPANEGMEVVLTSENFEAYYSSRWGAGFRPIDFSEVAADRLVELIEGAQSSIYVAAGFLRSRPVSEALIRRWQQDPELDIRLYLDQSEYISQWYHNSQLGDLSDCLEEAEGDEGDIYDCQERGFIFSYQLLDAEIPVRFKNYSYRWHYSYARQMHHKYMIFDEEQVATGSYNFSNNAEQNTMENILIYSDLFYPGVVQGFVENFNEIWETGRSDDLFDSVLGEFAEASVGDELDLIFEPGAFTWEEVTELRQLIRQRCPVVNSEEYRRFPEDNRTCTVE